MENFNVREEINDTEVMLNWLFDGTSQEGWMNYEQNEDGSLVVYDEDGNPFNVIPYNFLVGCEGIVSVDYIGNGNYRVVRVENEI